MTGRVAVVLHEPGAGGASRAALAPVPWLAERGWTFTFWVPGPGSMAEELRDAGHRVHEAPRHLRYSISALREPPGIAARLGSVPGYLRTFGAWVRRERPDLVHLNTLLTLPEAMVVRAVGRPTLLHVHEMLPGDARGRAAGVLARRCDRVMTVSGACRDALAKVGVTADVVRLGVPTVGRPPGPPRRGLVVGALGTVSRRKGSEAFVALAEQLGPERADVAFRLVGPLAPGREQSWAAEVVRRGRRAGVAWSTTDDAAAELAGWDVLVLASRADPFPLVVLEAMAAGVPVVAWAVDGVPEQVGNAAGMLVPPGDEQALAGAVRALLDDPSRRAALAEAGVTRVRSCFTPASQAAATEASYLRVIDATARHVDVMGDR